MPVFHYHDDRRCDYKALEAFVRAKGLTPHCRKWGEVCARHRHKFLK